MQLGSNTNVRYGAAQFHVQTEDSGAARPHVITHLYHQGVILASTKGEYAHLLGRDDLEVRVRALMDEQHQAMVARLRSGELDAVLRERLPDLFGSPQGDTGQTGRDTQPSSLSPPPPERSQQASRPRTVGQPDPPARPPAFDEKEVEGEKPLDELILQYLIDNARERGGGR
jgi:hypothetical protein